MGLKAALTHSVLPKRRYLKKVFFLRDIFYLIYPHHIKRH